MAIRTITWTVDEDMRVTPTRVQDAGVQGDDNATRVVFSLPAFLRTDHRLYIECINCVGEYDKTNPLPVSDGKVSFALPLKWTQHGGEATLRLVATQAINGVETLVAHSEPECRVRYAGRAKAFAKIKSLIEGSIQATLDKLAAAQDRIAKMIADAKVWIDNVNGVYVGGGDMPEGCVIQIDPEGEAETAEEWIRTEGQAILDMVYPVGSIYMSVSAADPSALFGGTWERLKDRFLLGAGDSYAAGATGGEETHTLEEHEMPSHKHVNYEISYGYPDWTDSAPDDGSVKHNLDSGHSTWAVANAAYCGRNTSETGGNQPHNNMPPYLAVYMWKRTA